MNKKITTREILFVNGKSAYRNNRRDKIMNNPPPEIIQQTNDIVTFDKLGNNGRLGNQLFQIAVTIATAKKHKADAIFPKWFCKYTTKDFSLFFENPIKQDSSINVPNVYNERSFTYSPIPYHKGVCLRGYYQSEKYFEDCKEDIRFYFKPKESVINELKKKYKEQLKGNTCCVHIRRGDYVNNPFHYVCDENYYNTAIDNIRKMTKINRFLIFSDDIEWCKKNFNSDDFYFVEGNKDIEDLFLMTLCKNHIISNSSFSWWGSWLCENDKKIIIAPNRWFSEESSTIYKDVYTSNMIRI
jgi:hypothetical protein